MKKKVWKHLNEFRYNNQYQIKFVLFNKNLGIHMNNFIVKDLILIINNDKLIKYMNSDRRVCNWQRIQQNIIILWDKQRRPQNKRWKKQNIIRSIQILPMKISKSNYRKLHTKEGVIRIQTAITFIVSKILKYPSFIILIQKWKLAIKLFFFLFW